MKRIGDNVIIVTAQDEVTSGLGIDTFLGII